MEILGVSFDSPGDNAAFARKFDFPYRLLSDPDRSLGLAYGACTSPEDEYARRLTYVIGPDGAIESAIDTQDPEGQAEEILRELRGRIVDFSGVRFVSEGWSCDVPVGWVLDWNQGVASMYDPSDKGTLAVSWYQKEGHLDDDDLDELVRDVPGKVTTPRSADTVAFPLGQYVRAVEEGREVHHWLKATEDLLVYVTYDGEPKNLPFAQNVVDSLVGYPDRIRNTLDGAE